MSENRESIMVIKRAADGRMIRLFPDGHEEPWTPPVLSEADWAAIDARSDAELTAAAEADPDNPPLSDDTGFTAPGMSPDMIRAIREGLDLSQVEFARTFGFSVSTYRDWEYGRRAPRGPAMTLLRVIAADPEAVRRVINAA